MGEVREAIPGTPPPLAMVGAALRQLRVPFEFINQREFASHTLGLSLGPEGMDGVLTLGGTQIPLSSIAGVYDRSTDPSTLPEMQGLDDGDPIAARAIRFHYLLSTYLQTSRARVINRWRPMSTDGSKPYQAQLISRYFDVPETLITNDPDVARAFVQESGAIYKSISGERSIVMDFTPEDLERLHALATCPVQFQRRIRGLDVRVYVVGSSVHACSIETGVLDYRYAQKKGHAAPKLNAVELPAQMAERCRDLTASLGLEFGGLDFVIDEEGTPWCLEVNTCPAYNYFEMETGLPIAASLARHLAGRTQLPS